MVESCQLPKRAAATPSLARVFSFSKSDRDAVLKGLRVGWVEQRGLIHVVSAPSDVVPGELS